MHPLDSTATSKRRPTRVLLTVNLSLVCTLLLWERPTGAAEQVEPPKLVIDTQGFTSAVESLDFSPKGDLLAAGGDDKVVRIWDVQTHELRATLRGYDGKGAEGICQAVLFSPDGHFLVVGVQDNTAEGAIRVYDTTKLDEIQALLPGHSQTGVIRLAFSDDGRFLASVGADGEVILWSWPDRQIVGRVRVEARGLRSVGFVANLPILFALDTQGFHAWSARAAKPFEQLTPGERAELGPSERIQAGLRASFNYGALLGGIVWPNAGRPSTVRLLPAADLLIAGGNGKREGRDTYWSGIWSTRDRRQIAIHTGNRLTLSAGAVTRDGSLAASADITGEIRVWDARTGVLRHAFISKGKSIYKVGFSVDKPQIAFGTKPFPGKDWGFNHYGDFGNSFDYERKQISDGTIGDHLAEAKSLGDRVLSHEFLNGQYHIQSRLGGVSESQYPLPKGMLPQSYGLLRSKRPGPDPLAILGRSTGSLLLIDPRNMTVRRTLFGHKSPVNAFGESPDGRFLVSGSDDRTIRFWALQDFKRDAWPDFDTGEAQAVSYLIPGGEAERAHIQLGDRFIRMDGKDVGVLYGEYLAGTWPYRDNQRVVLDMERSGRPYQVELPLVAQGDFAEPAMTLFIADDDWVIWTPQGYYDASPLGDRLIGWVVNQGRAKSAKFYLAAQFRKSFYRPDVIARIFKTGRVDAAILEANSAKPRSPKALDLRLPETLATMEPPHVRLTEPANGAHTNRNQITLSGMVESVNSLPLTDVRILVNGRPVAGKSVTQGAGDTDRSRAIDREVTLQSGPNTISVIAANKLARSGPALVRVYCDAATQPDPANAYVLAVGISEYKNLALEQLNFAHEDAEQFAAAWETQKGGPIYADVKTHVLTNKGATASEIREGMDWLRRSVTTKNDLAVIFISAHGIDDEDGFFVASHEVDPRRLNATAIPNTDIIRLVEGLRCRVLVFLDTCHSGKSIALGAGREDAFRDLASEEVGAWMFASSTAGGLSQELARFKHGAFTKAILDTLADQTCYDDQKLATIDLASQLIRRVAKLTSQQQKPIIVPSPRVPSFNFFSYSPKLRITRQRDRPDIRITGH